MTDDDQKREKRLMRNYLTKLPPKWLFGLGAHYEVGIPPPMKVLFDAGGFMLPQWLYTIIRLDLPDIIGQTPGLSTEELASSLDVEVEVLDRLLNALMNHGYFDASGEKPRTWRNSDLSATLRREHPNSVRALVIHWIEDCYAPFGQFYDALKQKEIPFVSHHRGKYTGFFDDYLTASAEGRNASWRR